MTSAILLITVSGCSSDGDERPGYMGAATVKSLEIPPKLSIPDTQGALHLPKPAKSAESAGTPNTTVIAPSFSGYELKNDSRLYWLEIDMPVLDVWQVLPEFLASEGIKVDRVEKLLGFIDTEWMSEYKVTYADKESSSSWFGSFSPDYKDRFRIRLEAGADENKTRMFVSHRGLQISVAGDVTGWVQRDNEPFLEREILYRFVLYNGINKQGATELLSAYHSFQPRVDRITDTSTEFMVKGTKDTIWMRLQIALDRLGVDILSSDNATKSLLVKVGSLNVEETPPEDDSGWFDGLFSGKDVVVDEYDGYENDPPENDKRSIKVAPEDQITLRIQQKPDGNSSQIKITNEDGSEAKGQLVLVFRDALLNQLK